MASTLQRVCLTLALDVLQQQAQTLPYTVPYCRPVKDTGRAVPSAAAAVPVADTLCVEYWAEEKGSQPPSAQSYRVEVCPVPLWERCGVALYGCGVGGWDGACWGVRPDTRRAAGLVLARDVPWSQGGMEALGCIQ